MILVHRLRGEPMYLNPDLVESLEATPDTVLTLIDGRRMVVSEEVEAVVDRIMRFRASVLVLAEDMRQAPRPSEQSHGPGLRVVEGGDD